MKLYYPLSETHESVLSDLGSQERIIYCVPSNVDIDGNIVDGLSVITNQRFISLRNGLVDVNRTIVPDDLLCPLGGCPPSHLPRLGSATVEQPALTPSVPISQSLCRICAG